MKKLRVAVVLFVVSPTVLAAVLLAVPFIVIAGWADDGDYLEVLLDRMGERIYMAVEGYISGKSRGIVRTVFEFGAFIFKLIAGALTGRNGTR